MKDLARLLLLIKNRWQKIVEFGLIIGLQLLAAAGSFASVKVLTRLLPQSIYGQVSLALTVITLAQLCLAGPVNQAAVRFYSAAVNSNSSSEYVASLTTMFSVISGGAITAGLLMALYLWLFQSSAVALVLIATLTCIIYSGSVILDGIHAGARRRTFVALHQVAAQWGRPLIASGFIVLLGKSTISVMLGICMATLLVVSSQLRRAWDLTKNLSLANAFTLAPTSSFSREMFRYAIPFVSWGFVSWLQSASDRWFLELFRDAKSVAAFAVAYQLGYMPLSLLCIALSSYLAPSLFHSMGDGSDDEQRRRVHRLNWIHVSIVGLLTLLLALAELRFSNQIVLLLSTRAYLTYASSLPWMTLACGFFSLGQAFTFFFLLDSDSAKLVPPKIGTALIGGALNGVCVYRYGVDGAITGAVLYGLLYCSWMLFITLKRPVRRTVSISNSELRPTHSGMDPLQELTEVSFRTEALPPSLGEVLDVSQTV